jgi:hypothetical protein
MRYVLRREKEQLGVFNDFARLYDKRQAWIISRIQSRLPQLIKPVLEDIVERSRRRPLASPSSDLLHHEIDYDMARNRLSSLGVG